MVITVQYRCTIPIITVQYRCTLLVINVQYGCTELVISHLGEEEDSLQQHQLVIQDPETENIEDSEIICPINYQVTYSHLHNCLAT